MEIDGPKLPPVVALAQIASSLSVVDTWKTGQLLKAMVVTPPQNGQLTINVGGALLLAQTQFTAQPPIPLQPGQSLQLEVTNLATQAILKLINQGSSSPSTTFSLPSQAHVISQWQTGKIVEAIAQKPTQTGAIRLNLSGQLIDAKLSQPVPLHQPLKLEILNPGTIAVLRILSNTPGTESLGQAIRSALPQQAPLTPLLTNLNNIVQAAKTPGETTQALPREVVEIAHKILNALPSDKTLSNAAGLQQALNQSGLFLEAKISRSLLQTQGYPIQTPLNLATDFKGSLLSLLVSLFTLTKVTPVSTFFTQAMPQVPLKQNMPQTARQTKNTEGSAQQTRLQQTLVELLRHVESSLSRIILNQLVSSASEDEGKRSWVMEIPVHHNQQVDTLQLRINKEDKNEKNRKSQCWTVNLALELKTLGPIQASITLANSIIKTVFWAERPQTNSLINEHLPSLQQRLTDAGLTVGEISAHCGKSPEPMTDIPPLPQVLLDVKA